MKTRNGFVSNSSSSSFIVIASTTNPTYIERFKKIYSGDVLVVDYGFGNTEFGWEFEKYTDFNSKLIFAFCQASYLTNADWVTDNELKEKGKTWLAMLENVVKQTLGVTSIDWKISINFNSERRAYIDHQSASYEGANTEMFDSEEALTCFLFNEDSYIETGNDNE